MEIGGSCIRIQLNRNAIHLLNDITQVDNRNHLAIQLANEYGYDVWEACPEEAIRVQFSNIDDTAYNAVPVAGLTRQYWAREVLGVTACRRAIKIWLLVSLSNPAEVYRSTRDLPPLVYSLSGISKE